MRSDVSIIITAHNENRLAHPTLNSVFRTIKNAEEYGIKSELIIVLDRADTETKNYFQRYHNSKYQIYQTDFGDPGLSRNFGVKMAASKFITFLDADDLFSKKWVQMAYAEAKETQGLSVFHPEYVINFGSDEKIIRFMGPYENNSNPSFMIQHNCMNSVHFLTEKKLLIEKPFSATKLDSGFGYEDWHWYCEIIAMDIPIKIVPGTCVFYRKKDVSSRLLYHNIHNAVIPPSKLFEPSKFSKILEKEKKLSNSS
jgi:glycosyltransferase involved in cell wall biosynthesis